MKEIEYISKKKQLIIYFLKYCIKLKKINTKLNNKTKIILFNFFYKNCNYGKQCEYDIGIAYYSIINNIYNYIDLIETSIYRKY